MSCLGCRLAKDLGCAGRPSQDKELKEAIGTRLAVLRGKDKAKDQPGGWPFLLILNNCEAMCRFETSTVRGGPAALAPRHAFHAVHCAEGWLQTHAPGLTVRVPLRAPCSMQAQPKPQYILDPDLKAYLAEILATTPNIRVVLCCRKRPAVLNPAKEELAAHFHVPVSTSPTVGADMLLAYCSEEARRHVTREQAKQLAVRAALNPAVSQSPCIAAVAWQLTCCPLALPCTAECAHANCSALTWPSHTLCSSSRFWQAAWGRSPQTAC